MTDYVATVRSARTAIPIAVEMEELFPETDHFITHFGFDDGSDTKTWNTESFFGGRHRLTMQVEVHIDYQAKQVKQVGKPTFFLQEVDKLDPLGGTYRAHTPRGMQFGIEEWKILREARGDLSIIGFTAKTGAVTHFPEYVAAWRRPRVPVSLLADGKKGRRAN